MQTAFVPPKTFSWYILLKKSVNQTKEVAVVWHGGRRRSAPARSGASQFAPRASAADRPDTLSRYRIPDAVMLHVVVLGKCYDNV